MTPRAKYTNDLTPDSAHRDTTAEIVAQVSYASFHSCDPLPCCVGLAANA